MAKKKPAAAVLIAPSVIVASNIPPIIAPLPEVVSLTGRVTELEGDLVRVIELIINGDLDSAKFRAILTKRQGKA